MVHAHCTVLEVGRHAYRQLRLIDRQSHLLFHRFAVTVIVVTDVHPCRNVVAAAGICRSLWSPFSAAAWLHVPDNTVAGLCRCVREVLYKWNHLHVISRCGVYMKM